jgi:hypothetical protein
MDAGVFSLPKRHAMGVALSPLFERYMVGLRSKPYIWSLEGVKPRGEGGGGGQWRPPLPFRQSWRNVRGARHWAGILRAASI